MPLINLIQEQRLAKRREERRSRLFFFGFVASAMASLTVFGFLWFQTELLRDEEARLNAQKDKLEPMVQQIEDNEKLYRQISPRLTTLQDAQLLTQRWDRLLEHLVVNTPAQAWMTSVKATVTDPTKPITIDFAGLAHTQEVVGELIMRLQNSTDLQSVNLKYTAEKVIQLGSGIEFMLSAELAGTAEQKPKDESKEDA